MELIEMAGSVVTIDAAGATEKIMEAVRRNGGDFVLQIKRNCPALYDELMRLFDGLAEEREARPHIACVGRSKQVRILQVQDKQGNDTTPGIEEFLKEGSRKQPCNLEKRG